MNKLVNELAYTLMFSWLCFSTVGFTHGYLDRGVSPDQMFVTTSIYILVIAMLYQLVKRDPECSF